MLKSISPFGCLKTKELVLIDFLRSHRMLYLFAERSNVNKASTLITLGFAVSINLKQFIFTRRGNDSCLKETTDVKDAGLSTQQAQPVQLITFLPARSSLILRGL